MFPPRHRFNNRKSPDRGYPVRAYRLMISNFWRSASTADRIGPLNGTPSTHPLTGRELRALRRHQRESEGSPFVFVSERGAPLTAPGFSRMVERAASNAKLGIKAHAHMLRHACGYAQGERRARHPLASGLPGSPQYPEHHSVHSARAGSVQRLLERLTPCL
jgi:integrase